MAEEVQQPVRVAYERSAGGLEREKAARNRDPNSGAQAAGAYKERQERRTEEGTRPFHLTPASRRRCHNFRGHHARIDGWRRPG